MRKSLYFSKREV